MFNTILIRRRNRFVRIPGLVWKRNARTEGRRSRAGLSFMSPDHHRVRDFVVSEIGKQGEALEPSRIAAGTGVPEHQLAPILDELERNLTFLFRRDGQNVDWAYPVTAEHTPHRVRLDSGERFFGA